MYQCHLAPWKALETEYPKCGAPFPLEPPLKLHLFHFPLNWGNSLSLSLFPFLVLKFSSLLNKIVTCHWTWPTSAKFITTSSPISIKSHPAFPSQELPGVLNRYNAAGKTPTGSGNVSGLHGRHRNPLLVSSQLMAVGGGKTIQNWD